MTDALGMRALTQLVDEQEASAASAGLDFPWCGQPSDRGRLKNRR